MKTRAIRILRVAAASFLVANFLPAAAAESQDGVVLHVHSEGTTEAFLKKLNMPADHSRDGRFAVVRLIDGSWGAGSFALVWVPQHFSIHAEDRVELVPSGDRPLLNPGSGVVTRVSPSLASVP
jgi:hypothetical protein